MLWLDAFFRIGAITLLLLGAILAIRDRMCWRPTVFIVLAAIGVSGMLISSAPDFFEIPMALKWPASILESFSVVFVWWFGLALFRDNFRLSWPHYAVLIILPLFRLPHNIADITQAFYYPPLLALICQLIVVAMMVHLIFVIMKESEDDLVASRRESRRYFAFGLVASVLLSTFASQGWLPIPDTYDHFVKSASVFPLALWFTLWLSRLDHKNLSFDAQIDESAQSLPEPTIDPRDQALLKQLISAMETDKIFREPGLTIRNLAETLGTPEHRLRALINQGLGYRNFSAFLNSYRIEAVKSAFQDPKMSRTPILTLAMDVGYNSLAPFNKAFREFENMTPTTYRQNVLAQADG